MNESIGKVNCVVIVDNDKHHAVDLQSTLIREGYHVKIWENIDDALCHAGEVKDVMAVLLQNHESQAELKLLVSKLKEKFGTKILLIMIDIFSIEAMRMAVMSGFHEFLAKPVGQAELITVLKRKKQGVTPRKISMTIKLEATILDE